MPFLLPARFGRARRRLALYGLLCASALGLTACGSLPPMPPRTASTALAAPQATPLGQMVQNQRQAAGTRYTSGFTLLGGAQAAFTSRLALVQAATQTLDLQYYAIHADASTARLLEALVQAAQRGVRVRVLLDDFHGAGKNAQVMRLAFVPGIEMRMFNPLTGPRGSTVLRALSTLTDFQRAQQRMHNKLFIADNSIGITGGRNLGDAYFDALDSDNFIDLDVMAAGAAVRQLSASFDRYWNDARAYPVSALVSEPELVRLRVRTSEKQEQALVQAAIATSKTAELQPMDLQAVPWIWAPALVLADAPGKIPPPPEDVPPDTGSAAPGDTAATPPADAEDSHASQLLPIRLPPTQEAAPRGQPTSPNRQALRQVLAPVVGQDNVVSGLLALIDQASSDILIVSPYFVPGDDMKQAFARARARGIRLRILTNSLASNDAPLAHAGYARHRLGLLQQGIELYELRSLQDGRVGAGTLRGTAGTITGSQGQSRAMLHSKMLVLDHKLTVVGSMNLDMRSQLQNTEIALLIASRQLAQEATANIEATLQEAAWRVEDTPQGLVWRAPAGSDWGDRRSEPDASLPLRLMIQLIGPLAPDHLL
jgi:phosphatidylserine/phosphatidylglycerophosphate/cardiolipin synthase-like enzyme